MLRPRKGFENSEVSFKMGSVNMNVKVSDITPELIERTKHYADLSAYVEQEDIEVPTELIELQVEINKPKRKRKK